jgi:hypothetical protein
MKVKVHPAQNTDEISPKTANALGIWFDLNHK